MQALTQAEHNQNYLAAAAWSRLQHDGLSLGVALVESKIRQAWSMRRRCRRVPASIEVQLHEFRFPPDVIALAVRW